MFVFSFIFIVAGDEREIWERPGSFLVTLLINEWSFQPIRVGPHAGETMYKSRPCGRLFLFSITTIYLEKALDPFQYCGNIYAGGVANAAAIDIGHIGVDTQNNIGASQQVGTSGVTEAGAA